MNCETLLELEDHFGSRLESLVTCMDLANVDPCIRGSECREQLVSINQGLCDMEDILMNLRKSMKVKKVELTAAQALKEELDEMVKELIHMKENLPRHLQIVKRDGEENPLERLPLQEQHLQEDILPKVVKPKKQIFPRMDYIMRDEFTSVPVYMKGRITYEQLNGMVEVINEAVRKKYQLMRKPRNQLSDKKMKTYMKYKQQETKDTKGGHFFTAEDLTLLCNQTNDGSARNRLIILRHCNRLKEVRGGGLTRFMLVL